MSTRAATLISAEEFATMGDLGTVELVRGRVIPLTKPKAKHGRVAMRFAAAIAQFVYEHNLGEVYAAETGYVIEHNPDTVRAPDVSFVRAELVLGHDEEEWYPHSPDLAVEVVSPGDRPAAIEEKVRMWLDGGARSVWVVDPQAKSVTVHHPSGIPRPVREDEELRDDRVLPGFVMRGLKSIFSPAGLV